MNTYTHTRIHTHTRENYRLILGKLDEWDIIIPLPSRTRRIVGIPRLSRWFSACYNFPFVFSRCFSVFLRVRIPYIARSVCVVVFFCRLVVRLVACFCNV